MTERRRRAERRPRQTPVAVAEQHFHPVSRRADGHARSAFGWLLRAIAWITLVIAPVLLLLMMQIQFLPYHSRFIIWTQRIALLVDLALVWWLWRKSSVGARESAARRASWVWPARGSRLSLVASCCSPGRSRPFPANGRKTAGDWQFSPRSDDVGQPGSRYRSTIAIFNFRRSIPRPDRRGFPFSNTLVLPGLNVYEGLGIDDPKKAKWRDFVFRAAWPRS